MVLTIEFIEDIDKIINKGTWNNNQAPYQLFFTLNIIPEYTYKPELTLEELLELKGYTLKVISIILAENGKTNKTDKKEIESIINIENCYGFYGWLGDIPMDARNKRMVRLDFYNYEERLKKCYVNPDNFNYGIK